MWKLFRFIFTLQNTLINKHGVSLQTSQEFITNNIEEIENCYMLEQDADMIATWVMLIQEQKDNTN